MQPTGNNLAVPESTSEEILCPICEYDLRGQVEPRCPECGYKFDWNELRDRKRRLHPYLFEHHPEGNTRSLVRTFIGGMRPRKFWGVLFPTQPSNPRRLMMYWAVIASMWLLFCVTALAYAVWRTDTQNRVNRPMALSWLSPADKARAVQGYGSLTAWQDVNMPILPNLAVIRQAWNMYSTAPTRLAAVCVVAWPWATIAALMIFQLSMERAKVKPIHVVRCVIYSADATGLFLLTTVLSMTESWRVGPWSSAWLWRLEFRLPAVALVLAEVVLTYRLWVAYRKYLRFDHALATVAASQVMVGLLVWKLALDWNVLSW